MTARARVSLILIVLGTACGRGDKPVEKGANTTATKSVGMPAEMPVANPEDKPFIAGPSVHPASLAEWDTVDYKSRSIDGGDLKPLPLSDVQHVRAVIFGKHGRIFEDSTLQGWIASHSWYHADTGFTNVRMNPQERANLDVVREAEAEKHTQIESGDMRFYENRIITSAMLGTHSPQDWEVIEAEVLADHGYVFSSTDEAMDEVEDRLLQLQHYFNARYWYGPQPGYEAKQLSPIERQNLDTIAVAMMRQLGRQLSPGQMNLFQSTALSDSMLKNISILDLRLLRNEVYARHGRVFQTRWLADHFRTFPWYQPRRDFSDSELSNVERANIALITGREQQLHEQLGTRPLSVSDVRGLPPDDARRLRNEIYARHGRRFQDPGLRAYFSSFAWYKPTDAFRDDQLNDVERKNATLIRQYEQGRFTEG